MTNLNNTNEHIEKLITIAEKCDPQLLSNTIKRINDENPNKINLVGSDIIERLINHNIFVNNETNNIYHTIQILIQNGATIETKTLNDILTTNIYNKLTQLLIKNHGDYFLKNVLQHETSMQILIQQYSIMDILFKEIPLTETHRASIKNTILKYNARVKRHYIDNAAWDKLIIINEHLMLSKLKESKNNYSKINKI